MAKIFRLPRSVLNNYTCRGTPIILPYPSDSAVKTGFVTFTIGKKSFLEKRGPAKRITIGNKSYLEYVNGKLAGKPTTKLYGKEASIQTIRDRPFIKSFRYGFTNRASVEVVIIDTNGGKFTEFIRNIPETCAQMKQYRDYKINLNYGWIYQTINGDVKLYDLKYTQNITYLPDKDDPNRKLPIDVGEYELQLILNNIEVSNSNGLWAYTLHLTDVTYAIKREENLKSDKDTPGTDANKVPLADAVDQLIQQCGEKVDKESHFATVKVADARNASNANNGQTTPQGRVLQAFKFRNSDGGAKGPRSVYLPNNQNSLDVVRSYVNDLVSAEGNGMFFTLDARSTRPFLYIVEDNFNKDEKVPDECKAKPPIATYIVNGGSASPVLGFDIQVSINRVGAIGGVGPNPTGSTVDAGDKPKDVAVDPDNNGGKKAYGIETMVPIGGDVTNFRAPQEANNKGFEAIFQNSLASQMYESVGNLRGTLALIGDPWYCNSITIVGQSISIIYLEAYSVGSLPGSSSCDYGVSNSMVNDYISGKKWMVQSVSHEITEDGRFTTMLEVNKVAKTAKG